MGASSLRQSILLLLLIAVAASGCSGPFVFGEIRPEHFQFKTTIPKRGSGAGGWREACVVVYLANLQPGRVAPCDIQVGCPIAVDPKHSGFSFVPVEEAQAASARAANQAIREVLSQPGPLLAAPTCLMIRERMRVLFKKEEWGTVPGARIDSCTTPGLKRVEVGKP